MNVLYQSDDNFAVYMGVSILSCLRNNQALEELNVYVIDDAISRQHKEQIAAIATEYHRPLVWISAKRIREETSVLQWPPYAGSRKNTNCYLKYFLLSLADCTLPNRILYIDCDTLVLGSLAPLETIHMQGAALGMTRCSLVCNAYKSLIGLGEREPYYNAGINLFDTKAWETQRCTERVLETAKKSNPFATVDQDILNLALHDTIMDIGCAYNFQPLHFVSTPKQYLCAFHPSSYYSDGEIAEATKAPVVVHFLKFFDSSPWHKNHMHPCTAMFDQYLALSPWAAYEKKQKTIGWKNRIEWHLFRACPRLVFLKLFYFAHSYELIRNQRRVKKLVMRMRKEKQNEDV